MSLNEMGKEFLEVSNSKGFTHGAESREATAEKLMLIVSELAEALEEIRKPAIPADVTYYTPDKPGKPEGFPAELADVIIRTLQLAAAYNIDIDKVVALKNAYNKTRSHKHGKVF